jgi:hypothetical protein
MDQGQEQLMKKVNQRIAGKEFYIRGKSKYSDYSSQYEIQAFSLTDVDPKVESEKLMKEIELLSKKK